MEPLVLHEDVPAAELAFPRLRTTEIDMVLKIVVVNRLLSKIADLWSAISRGLVRRMLGFVSHVLAEFAAVASVALLVMLFLFCFADDFPAVTSVHMSDSIRFV